MSVATALLLVVIGGAVGVFVMSWMRRPSVEKLAELPPERTSAVIDGAAKEAVKETQSEIQEVANAPIEDLIARAKRLAARGRVPPNPKGGSSGDR